MLVSYFQPAGKLWPLPDLPLDRRTGTLFPSHQGRMAFDLASDVQAKNRHFENQWLIKSKPRASAREDLKRNWRSVGSRGKKCVVRRSIGSKGRKKHWCGERELSSPIKSMVLPGKR
jgi:hypothetical protein